MRIRKLQLKNGFKRFYDLTIDLGENPKKIIALVGPNGCGKSSILESMIFHQKQYGARIGNSGDQNNQYYSMKNELVFRFDNVIIDFVEGSFAQIMNIKKENLKKQTIFSYRSPYRYNSHVKVKQSTSLTEIHMNDYGASSAVAIDSKMEINYRRLYVKYFNYLHDTDCKPSEAKQKIIGDLNSSFKNCLDIEIVSIGSIDESKGTLYFTKKDQTTEFEFNVLSSGEKEVVDMLLDLYLRQDEYNDSIYIIDEPELHINTSIQRKLLIEINNLISDNCQIWIATHSIGFLRAIQEDFKNESQIIQFKTGINWASTSQTLTPIKNSLKKWKEIFETALDDLTGLLSPKRIIYCEGKDRPGTEGQEKGFDGKVYNDIFSEKYHDTLFISSGGNTELDQRSEIALAILTKVFSDVEILVLKDRDVSSGKINNENDRKIYLKTNPDNHRILIRWELENYLFDKEVLEKFCTANSLEFDNDSYVAFVTDVVNQNLKDETGKIKNICGITTSINSEKFKLQLSEFISEEMAVYKELEQIIFERA